MNYCEAAVFLTGLPDVAESRPHSRINSSRDFGGGVPTDGSDGAGSFLTLDQARALSRRFLAAGEMVDGDRAGRG